MRRFEASLPVGDNPTLDRKSSQNTPWSNRITPITSPVLSVPKGVLSLSLSPSGRYIAVGDLFGDIKIYDECTGQEMPLDTKARGSMVSGNLRHTRGVHAITWCPRLPYALYSPSYAGTVGMKDNETKGESSPVDVTTPDPSNISSPTNTTVSNPTTTPGLARMTKASALPMQRTQATPNSSTNPKVTRLSSLSNSRVASGPGGSRSFLRATVSKGKKAGKASSISDDLYSRDLIPNNVDTAGEQEGESSPSQKVEKMKGDVCVDGVFITTSFDHTVRVWKAIYSDTVEDQEEGACGSEEGKRKAGEHNGADSSSTGHSYTVPPELVGWRCLGVGITLPQPATACDYVYCPRQQQGYVAIGTTNSAFLYTFPQFTLISDVGRFPCMRIPCLRFNLSAGMLMIGSKTGESALYDMEGNELGALPHPYTQAGDTAQDKSGRMGSVEKKSEQSVKGVGVADSLWFDHDEDPQRSRSRGKGEVKQGGYDQNERGRESGSSQSLGKIFTLIVGLESGAVAFYVVTKKAMAHSTSCPSPSTSPSTPSSSSSPDSPDSPVSLTLPELIPPLISCHFVTQMPLPGPAKSMAMKRFEGGARADSINGNGSSTGSTSQWMLGVSCTGVSTTRGLLLMDITDQLDMCYEQGMRILEGKEGRDEDTGSDEGVGGQGEGVKPSSVSVPSTSSTSTSVLLRVTPSNLLWSQRRRTLYTVDCTSPTDLVAVDYDDYTASLPFDWDIVF